MASELTGGGTSSFKIPNKNYPLNATAKQMEVKNKMPAPVQITAEQLLREAVDRQLDDALAHKPQQRIVDEEELNEYRLNKRKEFEDTLRRQRHHIGTWIKYAEWEAAQKEFRRARSVFERALLVDYQNVSLWLKYIEMEAKNKFVMSCRNLYLSNRPAQESFLRFCKFEERHKNVPRARAGFEKAIELLPEDMLDEHFYMKFAAFEERHHEQARAKAIYEAALQRVPRGKAEELYNKYVAFQKQFGDREGLEETVLSKRRFVYEEALHKNKCNYDGWIDYIRLEESTGNIERTRNVYERAVANTPPILEKRYWTRYIYIWISYALFEELVAKDVDRCRAVYEKALEAVPHKLFSFAKLWTLFVAFEIRQLNLERARKIFGMAIAKCGKEKIFQAYSQLELRLGNIDRCRQIHAKFIETYPLNPRAWINMIELEILAEETERARALCELAVSMEQMEMPELVNADTQLCSRRIWKTYIDMEVNWGAFDRARALYERLLDKTQHVNAFKGYATFEWKKAEQKDRSRQVLNRGLDVCKTNGWDEERAALLEHWLALEREGGDAQAIQRVFRLLPKKIKKRKTQKNVNGVEEVTETLTYVFPDDEGSAAVRDLCQVESEDPAGGKNVEEAATGGARLVEALFSFFSSWSPLLSLSFAALAFPTFVCTVGACKQCSWAGHVDDTGFELQEA
ncbi:crooked neck family 1 protein isoform 2 [Cyclospora cayetanensis]|uniref:Crooked neck family 1 protein isoform 2 n=1 Tax=Cyclospora cayetanensis TaxID=88456 RepID=A0A1D3CXL0_9EIME|nr:crooked neck family 1 protein isoform 2 [Cyclospora cayetanensis]